MNAIIVASVCNTLHALNRVVSLLRGRDFHVTSLAIAQSEERDVARIIIAIDGARSRPERVTSCLGRLEEVWAVKSVKSSDVVRRELALIKLRENAEFAELVSAIIRSGAAQLIERSGGAVILEIVGEVDEVNDMVGSLPPDSILEIARAGQLVMARGYQKTTVVTSPV